MELTAYSTEMSKHLLSKYTMLRFLHQYHLLNYSPFNEGIELFAYLLALKLAQYYEISSQCEIAVVPDKWVDDKTLCISNRAFG